jgi:hypothetical protein
VSRTRRLAGIAALAAASASVLVVPGASAQTVEYGATSDGVGLELSLFGQGLTAGKAHSELTSAPQAAAEGAGIANPVSPAGATSASVEGADATNGSADETCDSDALPAIPGLSIALACSSSIASIAGGNPSSAATGRVAGIEANPVGALLDTPLAEVVPPVQDGLDQLLGGLAPVLGPVGDGAGIDLEDTISDLLDSLLEGAPLATVTLGPTQSSTTVADGTVTAACTASGGRIDVLDPPPVAGGADLPPAISVIVGDATTSVVASTTSGEDPVATADPAIVTVVVPSLGINQPVGPGENIEIPLPEPLGPSTISVAGGSTGTDDSGATFARASAVRLDLLNGEALMGGIELALADCLSVAGATITAAPTTTTAAPVAPAGPPLLARTGTDGPNGLALAASVGLAGLGLALLRRTRVQ